MWRDGARRMVTFPLFEPTPPAQAYVRHVSKVFASFDNAIVLAQ